MDTKKKILKKIGGLLVTPSIFFIIFVIIIVSSFFYEVAVSIISDSDSNFDESSLSGLPPVITMEILKATIESYEKYGVPTAITLAQIVQEAGVNGSSVSINNHNLFGITGNGTAGKKGKYANYNTYKECIDHHSQILLYPRYQSLLKDKSSMQSWAYAIQNGGYCLNSSGGIDTSYATNLMSLISMYNLERFNGVKWSQVKSIMSNGEMKTSDKKTTFGDKIVASASRTSYQMGFCAKYVADVYINAGYSYTRTCCANAHRKRYAKMSGEMPIGAIVYASPSYRSGYRCKTCNSDAGHVGIYIGGGYIVGAQTGYKWTLTQWYSYCGYGGWSTGDVKVN